MDKAFRYPVSSGLIPLICQSAELDLPLFVELLVSPCRKCTSSSPQYFCPCGCQNWGISPKKILMGGLPVKNIQHIYFTYICSLSANLVFLSPLMSLDVNLFQLLSQSYFSLITHFESWRISFPLLMSKITPFEPTFHRPSATGVRATVRYLHFDLHSKPGKLSPHLSSDWLTFLGIALHADLLLASPLEVSQRSLRHYSPQLPCLIGINLCLAIRAVNSTKSIWPLMYFIHGEDQVTMYTITWR